MYRIHLGAHISKVRSLALDRDAWTAPVMALFTAVVGLYKLRMQFTHSFKALGFNP